MNKLLKNKSLQMGGIYLIANIINKAIAFLTVPIFTRMLSTTEYGIVSTYSSYAMILVYFMGLSSDYTIRNAFIDYEKDIPKYMSSVYSLSIVSSLVVSVIVFVVNSFLKIGPVTLCICCLVQAFMTFIVNAMSYKLMMEKQHIKRSILIAGPNLISVCLGIMFILLLPDNKHYGRVFGYVGSFCLFGGICLVSVLLRNRQHLNAFYWKYILKIAPPLIIHGLSVIILAQLDRIMITNIRSAAETAVYSIVYSLSMVSMAVTQALQSVWTPWFTEKYKNSCYDEIDKRASKYLNLAAFLTIMIMLAAPEILKIMTPESYWSGDQMIPPLVITSYFIYAYSYYIGLELHEKKTKGISICTSIAAAANLILNWVFIPKFGALGASFTTLSSYLLLFMLHWFSCRRINKSVLHLRFFLLPSLGVIGAAAFFYIFSGIWLVRWGLLVVVTIISFWYLSILFKRTGDQI